jgi:2,5-diketo-D-gluconate reductase B
MGSEAVDIIRTAINLGYRHIDTAQLYENESEVGAAIIQSGVPRNEVYLVTKVWPSNLSKERFIPSVEESLEKLKTNYVDLLLIHWPHHTYAVEDYIRYLIEAKTSGLAIDIGVSNF